jgi:hypothetical protein
MIYGANLETERETQWIETSDCLDMERKRMDI